MLCDGSDDRKSRVGYLGRGFELNLRHPRGAGRGGQGHAAAARQPHTRFHSQSASENRYGAGAQQRSGGVFRGFYRSSGTEHDLVRPSGERRQAHRRHQRPQRVGPRSAPGELSPYGRAYLPKTAECWLTREGDIDGDGRPDLVLMYTPTHQRYDPPHSLNERHVGSRAGFCTTATNAHQPARTVRPASNLPLRNLNARPGDEILIPEGGGSAGTTVGVYTFDGHALVKAGGFLIGGYWLRPHGLFCHAGNPPTIVQRALVLVGHAPNGNGRWHETDTTYTWVGSTLRQTSQHTFSFTSTHYPANRSGFGC